MLIRFSTMTAAVVLAGLILFSGAVFADEATEKVSNTKAADAESAGLTSKETDEEETLGVIQKRLAARYSRFENTLLKMLELMSKSDPARADLLKRAIASGKTAGIQEQMKRIAALLDDKQDKILFGDVLDRQVAVVTHMRQVLEILQSEDRLKDIEAEKARIKDLLKDLNRVIGKETDVRAATERGENAEKVAERQAKVAKEAGDLVKKIDGQDAERNKGEGEPGEGKPGEGKPGEGKPGEGKPGEGKPGEGKPGEGKPGEGKPGEGKPGEGKPGEGKPGEGKPGEGKPGEGKPGEGKPGEGKPGEGKPGEGKPGEGKPGEGKPGEGKPGEGKPGEGKPGEGKPGEGKPGEGKPGEGKPGEQSSDDPNKTAGRDEIAQARQEMERAIEELKKLEAEAASKHQDEALQKLREAKEKLEEILRQLREEERKLLLQALEARFQKMLQMQLVVYAETTRLDKIVAKEEDANRGIEKISERSKQISFDEDDIALEAAKALTLLKEEGSSVAFPEAISQLREDMLTVAKMLGEIKVGELTQGIEKDIIEALEEVIEALQKEMEKMEKEKQEGQQGQQGQQQDPPLVDQLAELKMLRTLQLRINRRTRRLGRLIDGEQATEADVVDQLQQLSRRQSRIQEATYDIATGRNR